MFQNFLAAINFKMACRNLRRNKVYSSFINMAGLAIGLACAMQIIVPC